MAFNRRKLVRVAVAVGAIGFIWIAWNSWRAGAALNKELAKLRAEGAPLRMTELAPNPVAPESNAAEVLNELYEQIQAIERQMNQGDQFDDDGLTEKGRKDFVAALAGSPNLVQQLIDGSNRPNFDLQLDYNLDTTQFVQQLIDSSQKVRAASRILDYDATVKRIDGRVDESLANALSVFRWSDHCTHLPMMIGYLVSNAVNGVAVHQAGLCIYAGASPESCDELHAYLATHHVRSYDAWKRMIRSERAFGMAAFAGMPSRFLPSRLRDQRSSLKLYDALNRYGQNPSGVAPTLPKNLGALTQSLAPTFQAALGSHRRQQAQMRALSALVQWKRQGADAAATWESIEAAAADQVDPFNGKQMTFSVEPQGAKIYSVGPNLKDDGGKLATYDDIGIGPP